MSQAGSGRSYKKWLISLLLIFTVLFGACGDVSTKVLVPESEYGTESLEDQITSEAEPEESSEEVTREHQTKAENSRTKAETSRTKAASSKAAESETAQRQTTEKSSEKETTKEDSAKKQTKEKTDKRSEDLILNKRSKKIHRSSCASVKLMKEKNKWYYSGSCQSAINMGYVPCKNCNPDAGITAGKSREEDKSDSRNEAKNSEKKTQETQKKQQKTHKYVLNTNTKKFHYPSCSSVKQMKAKNKKVVEKTRSAVLEMGYDPCKRCNP